MEQKLIKSINELKKRTIILILELYKSWKKIVWRAQTQPISKIKYEPIPIKVKRKSEILAPKGPPRLRIVDEDDLLKKAGSEDSYDTKAIKINKEKAIKKKLKKLSNVFLKYCENIFLKFNNIY